LVAASGHLARRLMADFDYVGMDISADMLALAPPTGTGSHVYIG